MMDNGRVDVVGTGAGHLRLALSLAMGQTDRPLGWSPITYWADVPRQDAGEDGREVPRTMLLFSGERGSPKSAGMHAMPVPMHVDTMLTIAVEWLGSLEDHDRGDRMDLDGSLVPDAWRVTTEIGEDFRHVGVGRYELGFRCALQGMFRWVHK